MNRFGKKILCGCLAVSLMLTSVGCSEKTENAEEQTISGEGKQWRSPGRFHRCRCRQTGRNLR